MKPILGQFICIVVKNVSNFCKNVSVCKDYKPIKSLEKSSKEWSKCVGVCEMSESNAKKYLDISDV